MKAVLLGGPDDGLEVSIQEPYPLTLRTVQIEQPNYFDISERLITDEPVALKRTVTEYRMLMRMAKPVFSNGRIVYGVEGPTSTS